MRFRPDPTWERRQALESAGAVRDAARAAAEEAQSLVEVDSGDTRDSIKVLDEPNGATLYGDDRFFHLVEWGSVNNRAQRPLTNAAMRNSDRFDIQ